MGMAFTLGQAHLFLKSWTSLFQAAARVSWCMSVGKAVVLSPVTAKCAKLCKRLSNVKYPVHYRVWEKQESASFGKDLLWLDCVSTWDSCV